MKKILIPTLLLAALLFAGPNFADAQSSTSRTSVNVSTSERQVLLRQLVADLRDITSANLDAPTRSFLISQLLEVFTQSLAGYDERDDYDDDRLSSREYDRVVDAVEDYLEDEENEDDYDIGTVRRRGSGYEVEVELDRYCTAEVEVDNDYDVDDYRVRCEDRNNNGDDRNDNSDNEYVDDTSRAFNSKIEFRLTFDLEADRDDLYIPVDLEDALEFEIQDDRKRMVEDENDLDNRRLYGYIDTTAKERNGYYYFEEDEEEEITFVITYEAPDDDDYRLQLNRLGYNDRANRPNDYLNFRSGRYVSDYYHLGLY